MAIRFIDLCSGIGGFHSGLMATGHYQCVGHIRNAMKRVRKKDSSIILASQNIEDFLIPSIREFTKPLFSIPTHQFLFNAGQINPKEYMDALQVEPSEFDLIKYPERGTCLYKLFVQGYKTEILTPTHKDWNEDLIIMQKEGEPQWKTQSY